MDPNGKLFDAKLEEGNGSLGDKTHHQVKGVKVSNM